MASFVILILGASSCTHDVGVNEGGPSGEMSGFSLQLQTPKGAYLTRAIAIGDENSISSIEIYAFDGDNMVGTNYLSEGTDYTTTVSGTTTTVNFTEEWVSKVAGKDITFYAVVNEDCGNGTTVTALNSGTPPTAKAAFEALVSDALPVEDDMVEMGINADFLMTGQSEPVKIVGKASGKITAKRRVARFDIVNPMAAEGDGQLVITNVQAFNAPVEGNVFASGPALTPARADYDFISFNTGSGFNLPVWSSTVTDGKNGNYVAETNSLGEDTWRCASAFYMYPTQLSPEAGAESMNLYVEAEQNGVKQVYVPAGNQGQLPLHAHTAACNTDIHHRGRRFRRRRRSGNGTGCGNSPDDVRRYSRSGNESRKY